MIILPSALAAVNSADRIDVFPLALPTELDLIERDAREMFEDFADDFAPTPEEEAEAAELLNGADDNFDPPVDSPLWDEWAADSMALDAVCNGFLPM